MTSDPYQKQRVECVQAWHQSPMQIVAALSSGGTLVLSDLLTVPGGSRTLIEATVPYSYESISDYIGRVPEQFCCSRTARNLAMTAFYHARRILRSEILRKQGHVNIDRVSPKTVDVSHEIDVTESAITRSIDFVEKVDLGELDTYRHVIGVGCTASLATDRQKQGEHRAHVAVQTLQETIQFSLYLQKDARTRWEEERLVADLVLNAIETARRDLRKHPDILPQYVASGGETSCPALIKSSSDCTLAGLIPLQLKPGEKIQGKRVVGSSFLVDLFFGKLGAVLWTNNEIRYCIASDDVASSAVPCNLHADFSHAIFPGGFSPIHRGHVKMRNIAEQRLHHPVVLEMSVQNVNKPPLDYIELEHRLEHIHKVKPEQAIWLTRAPLFVSKAKLFPGATFVVGADTIKRFADLRFYHDSSHKLHDILRQLAFYNCRFLVFARKSKSGLESLDTLTVPDMLRSLCDSVPPSVFTMDISSSDIRRQEPP